MTNPFVLTVPQAEAQQLVTQSGQLLAQTAPLGSGTLPPGTIVGQLLVWNGTVWTLLNPAQAGYVFQGQGLAAIPAYGPPDFVIVANVAALEALQLNEVGTTAYVITTGALWTVTPSANALTTDGITCVLNFQGAPLYWLRGASLVAPLAAQQGTWWLDGVNGNDENAGTSAAAAVKTISNGIAARFGVPGNTQVRTAANVPFIIAVVNGQAAGLEEAQLDVTLVGAGAYFAIVPAAGGVLGTYASVSTGDTLGTVTARNRTTGHRLTSTFTATVGQLVRNVTAGKSSRAFVSVFSTPNSTFENPYILAPAPATFGGLGFLTPPTQVNTWATGDSVDVDAATALNLRRLSVRSGGDLINTGDTSLQMVVIEGIHFLTNAAGADQTFFSFNGVGYYIYDCLFDSIFTHECPTLGGGLNEIGPTLGYYNNCLWTSGFGPSFLGNANLVGGGTDVAAANEPTIFAGLSNTIDGDFQLNEGGLKVYPGASLTIGTCYAPEESFPSWEVGSAGDTFYGQGLATIVLSVDVGITGATILWGGGSVAANFGGRFYATGGSTDTYAVACATVPTFFLGGASTGYAFNRTTAVWSGPVSITGSAIDTNQGLIDPNSGSGYLYNIGFG